MYQIVAFPDAADAAGIESFRRCHDPSFHEIAAHVALAPPFREDDPAGLVRRFLSFDRTGPLEMMFAPPESRSRALLLPVLDGAGRVSAAVGAIRDSVLPLSARLGRADGSVALRLGLFASDGEAELARRAWLATEGLPTGFRAGALTLLLADERGLWHEVRKLALSAD